METVPPSTAACGKGPVNLGTGGSLFPLGAWAGKVVGRLGARHARLVLFGELGVHAPRGLGLAVVVLGRGVLLAQVRPLDLRAVRE